MIQLQLRRELRAVVPLELPPRQKFLLRDEGLRLRLEPSPRRAAQASARSCRSAQKACDGGDWRRAPAPRWPPQPQRCERRGTAAASAPPCRCACYAGSARSWTPCAQRQRRGSSRSPSSRSVVAVPGAGLAFCKRRPTTWLLEARLGWLGRPRAPLRVPGGVALALRFAFGRVMHLVTHLLKS